MSNRRFEMYEIRQVLVRMRQGDSDRQLARSALVGRHISKPDSKCGKELWLAGFIQTIAQQ